MGFAARLEQSLESRAGQVPAELARGDGLEKVLTKHLLEVERASDRELLTSVLLLSEDGKRLYHGAGPNLPKAYRDAIDGSEIGPRAGSCGTAAYYDRAVYVSDIATDPLWADYRDLALPHGLRSCWSTPIHDDLGAVSATFAIYHSTIGEPSPAELKAIEMISGHVGRAIMWARRLDGFSAYYLTELPTGVESLDAATAVLPANLLDKLDRLEALTGQLRVHGDGAESEDLQTLIDGTVVDCRRLISIIRSRTGIRSQP